MFRREFLQHLVRQQHGYYDDDDDDDEYYDGEVGFPELFRRYHVKENSSISSFEKMMQFDELSASYLEQGKFHEAYGLLQTQYEFGAEIHFARILVKYYVSLMKTDRPEKADKVREELTTLLEKKFIDFHLDVQRYAQNLVIRNKPFEAALFYQVSIQLSLKAKPDLIDGPKQVQTWSAGFRVCIQKLLEANLSKHVAKKYLVPWYGKVKEWVDYICPGGEKVSSVIRASCYDHASNSQILVGDFISAETFLKEAADGIERRYGKEAEKIGKYGEVIGSLGLVYSLQNRKKDAVDKLNQAILLMKKAEDYTSYNKKLADIKKYETVLKEIS